MGQEYYFETKALSVGYDGTPILSNVEIRLKKGEILSLIGPNGAGKTTILKSIIKQLTPMAGVVLLDQTSIEKMKGKELSEKMAVVLTNRLQAEMMTVEEVVATGRYPYTGKFGILSKMDDLIVEDAMQMTHVWDMKDRFFTKISDGQRQRVMLARALAQEPEIIVLDEPTSFLDIKHKMEFLSILKKLSREKGVTVIMSLHEVELSTRISDQVACFKNGILDHYGKPKDVCSDGYLMELFDIQIEEIDQDFHSLIMEMAGR